MVKTDARVNSNEQPDTLLNFEDAKGAGYIFTADGKKIYAVSHASVLGANRSVRAMSVKLKGLQAPAKAQALLIAKYPTYGLALWAYDRPNNWVSPSHWGMERIQTGENVRVLAGGGAINVQVVDAAYARPQKSGYGEIATLGESLKARIGLTYTRSLLGAIAVNHEDCLVGFISQRDPATGDAMMIPAYGFEVMLAETVKKFRQFLQTNPGIKVLDLLATPDVYANMRLAIAPRDRFLGISWAHTPGDRGGAVLYAIPDTVTADGALQERADYTYKESTVESPATRCIDLVSDYTFNKSRGYGTLTGIRWFDFVTGELVSRDCTIPGSDTVLDEALCRAGNKITLGIVWTASDSLPQTKSYILNLTEPVFDVVNGQRIEREAVDLSSLVDPGKNKPFYVPFLKGTTITTLDNFKAGLYARYGGFMPNGDWPAAVGGGDYVDWSAGGYPDIDGDSQMNYDQFLKMMKK